MIPINNLKYHLRKVERLAIKHNNIPWEGVTFAKVMINVLNQVVSDGKEKCPKVKQIKEIIKQLELYVDHRFDYSKKND